MRLRLSSTQLLLQVVMASAQPGHSIGFFPLLSIFSIDLKQNNCKQQFFLLTGNTTIARSEHTLLWAREKNKTSNRPLKSAGKKETITKYAGKIIQKSQLFRGFQEPSLPVFLEPFLVTLPCVRLVAEALIDEQRAGVLPRYSVHCAGFSRLS